MGTARTSGRRKDLRNLIEPFENVLQNTPLLSGARRFAEAVVPIRIVLADDHPIMVEGLEGVLETDPAIEVCATTGNGVDALQLIQEYRPDVAIIDIVLPGMSGIQVLKALQGSDVETRVIILTASDDHASIHDAISAGARGFLLKTAPCAEILPAIHQVAADVTVIAPAVTGTLARAMVESAGEPYVKVTKREQEILGFIRDGITQKGIADRLHLSLGTVQTHTRNLYSKLGAHNAGSAVAEGIRQGVIEYGRR